LGLVGSDSDQPSKELDLKSLAFKDGARTMTNREVAVEGAVQVQ